MPSTAAEVKLREQLALVIQVMQDNTVKISHAGGGFADLATRTSDAQRGATEFQRNASSVGGRLWWNNMVMNIIISILLLVTAGVLILTFKLTSPKDARNTHKIAYASAPNDHEFAD